MSSLYADNEAVTSPSFGAELRRLREERGWSLRAFQGEVNYAFGYLSKVETGKKPPTTDLAERCDRVLGTGTELRELAIAQARQPQQGWRLSTPAQLPAAVADFVGRDTALSRLNATFEQQASPGAVRVVAVDGTPGIGKTTLAVRWSHMISEQFPDGQLFANLRGYDRHGPRAEPGDVLEDFLRSLGMPSVMIPPGVEKRAALLRSSLVGKKVLLVLDNAATSEQVLPLLPGASSCMVVVTTRNRLSGLVVRAGAARVTLDVLSAAEALGLFRTVVGCARVNAEEKSADVLARRCGYLPLALRVAAEHTALHPHHSLAELAHSLSNESGRLDVLSSEEETETVRAVFDWSYRELPTAEARMFRLLGLHSGPDIGIHAAAALADCSTVVAHRLLETLAGAHLLEEVSKDRYRFHDLLRVYAAERARHEGSDEDNQLAVRRLLEWYLHSAAAANDPLAPQRGLPDLGEHVTDVVPVDFGDYDAALAWCELEASNVVRAVEQAHQHGLAAVSWKLAAVNFNFYFLRKRWNSWTAAHSRGLQAAREAGDRLGEAWCLHNLGMPYAELRRFDEAQEHLAEAVRIRREIDDQWGLGWSLFAQGSICSELGRFEEACERFQEAIDVFAKTDFTYGVGTILAWLGTAYRKLGRYSEAKECLEKALGVFTDLRAPDGEGFALVRLGAAYQAWGEGATALEYLDRALILRREIGDRWGQGEALLTQGHALLGDGQGEAARDSWHEAATIFDELSDPRAADARAQLATLEEDEVG